MDAQEWLIPTIAIVISAMTLWWRMTTTLATKDDVREINSHLDRIEQNHLEHITQLHVQTKQSAP